MKLTPRFPHFFTLLFTFFTLISCGVDQDFLLDTILEEEENQPEPNSEEDENGVDPPSVPDFNEEDKLDISTVPCDYDLSEVTSNATISIDCTIDLNGAQVSLPSGVTLEYTGGQVINGAITFSDGRIDGRLLNHTLQVEGDVQLIDPTFQFYGERWEMVQGRVADEVASQNTRNFEDVIFKAKELGANVFVVSALDVYLKTDGLLNEAVPQLHALNLPSDFTFALGDNVHLRMQPNGHFRAVLLGLYDVRNTIVTGGNFYGEREEHNYNSGFVDSDGSTGPTHEWVTLISLKGAQDILIDNVVLREAAGDGINISGINHFFEPSHIQSRNITIRNSKIIASRRTNIVVTDGAEIAIENNEIVDGGIDMANSLGTAPSSNLNLEPVRQRSASGELIEYQRVSGIYIRNNRQTVTDKDANPRAGDFQLSHGNGPLVVENNTMINSGVSFTTVDGAIIRNNTIENGLIGAGRADNIDRTDEVFGNEIYGNTIRNTSGVGINVAGNGVSVRDNNIVSPVGIALGLGASDPNTGLSNSEIIDNVIQSDGRGFISMNTSKNVVVERNSIDMLSGGTFSFVLDNKWNGNGASGFVVSDNSVTGFKPNTEKGAIASLLGGFSIVFRNNDLGEVQINGGRDMEIIGNDIEGSIGSNGIRLTNDSPNLKIQNNTTTIYPSMTPLQIECVSIMEGVTLSSNVVIEGNECIEN